MKRDIQLLIVDDNAPTRYAMRRVLERRGYVVLEAGTGMEGLALIEAQPIDALILDINLPDISGLEVARRLRADARTALLPVVHVSAASVETNDVINGLDAGADAYLIHPVDHDVLLATLRTLLRVRDTEAALRESEARFREIFANIAAPVAVIDATLTVHESNHAFARLIEESGGGSNQLADCFAEEQQEILQELRACLVRKELWRGTLSMRGGGALRETEWRVAPYRSPDFGIIFVEDVTEQHRRERQQRELLRTANTQLAREVEEHARTEAQLLQSQKMDAIGKLTGGIAHDFNNMLTVIITGVEIMTQRAEEGRLDEVLRFADAVLDSARRAAALTHRLLAFARQQPLDSRPVDVNRQVLSLEDLLRRTIGESVLLQFELTPGHAVARVDANQLENAILNLVINARDALTGGGQVTVATSAVRSRGDSELADGDYVALCVLDTGSGIAPEVIGKVFDPFFTTKPIGHGTGLGLSMIYGFARQSGGVARIQSRLGEGTEVTLLLPAGTLASEPAPHAESEPLRGQGEHVLLVEDTATVRLLAAELLTDAGYRCTHAADADAALQLLRNDAPIDLLLTDVGLPGMNGRLLADAARLLRPQLPVVFMTGYAENALARGDFLGPRMDMVTKPFETAELLGKLRSMLDA